MQYIRDLLRKVEQNVHVAQEGTVLLFENGRDNYGGGQLLRELVGLEYLGRGGLLVSCSLNTRHIPLLDCDSAVATDAARERLAAKGVRHAVLESSPGRFWVFPDMSFCDFESAYKATGHIPGCDGRYLGHCKRQGAYFVRGEPKDGWVPRVAHNDCREPNVVSFLAQLCAVLGDVRLRSRVRSRRLVSY